MQKPMLKRMVLAVSAGLLSLNAAAVAPGLYIGLMMGPATNGGKTTQMQVLPLPTAGSPTANVGNANPKSTQFGSRLYLGYKFNQYAAFEGGFTYFSGINYVLTNPALTPAAGRTARVRGIDLMGKLDYSYNNTVGLFGKGGVVANYTTTPGALNITNYTVQGTKVITTGSNTYSTKLSPVFAIGISYDIDQSWQADLSWTRYFVSGPFSSMDFYALGLSYHLVDRYCGQFLC